MKDEQLAKECRGCCSEDVDDAAASVKAASAYSSPSPHMPSPFRIDACIATALSRMACAQLCSGSTLRVGALEPDVRLRRTGSPKP